MNGATIRRFSGHFLLSTVGGVLAVSGGTFLFLLLASSIGYLPYSDRPGPGWYGGHLPEWQEVRFFAGFAFRMLALFAVIWTAFVFLFGSILAALRLPRVAIGIVTGLLSAWLAMFGIAAAGWMIAIAAAPVYVAGIC